MRTDRFSLDAFELSLVDRLLLHHLLDLVGDGGDAAADAHRRAVGQPQPLDRLGSKPPAAARCHPCRLSQRRSQDFDRLRRLLRVGMPEQGIARDRRCVHVQGVFGARAFLPHGTKLKPRKKVPSQREANGKLTS